jgi:hypothetical protein
MVDFLLFFTSRDMVMGGEGLQGLSPPFWNAAIIHFGAARCVIQHELSHQFNCPHCGNICVMNPDWCNFGVSTWCDTCQATINSNRLKWGIKDWVHMKADSGITTEPPVDYYQELNGTQVTVKADPQDPHHVDFKDWLFIWPPPGNSCMTASYLRVTANPYTFTVTNTTEVWAESTPVYTLIVIANTTEGTTDPSPGTYYWWSGTTVNLTATANPGYQFSQWIVYDPHTVISESVGVASLETAGMSQVLMLGDRDAVALFDVAQVSQGGGRLPPLIK